jgi:hypothetical protein
MAWLRKLRRPVLVAGLLAVKGSAHAQTSVTQARVEGLAYDSLAKRPLANAMISVVGLDRSATSDAKGRFRIDGVPVGAQTFLMQHPAFDSIGLSGSSQRVVVRPSGNRVVLALPPFERLWRATCGDAPIAADSGLIYGVVRDARTQEGIASVAIDMSWVDLVGGGASLADIGQRRWHRVVQTDSTGEFAVCGAPLSTRLSLSATRDSFAEIVVELPLTRARVQRRDLVIARVVASSVRDARPDSAGAAVRDSATSVAAFSGRAAALRGIVVSEAGTPLPNAIVSVETREDLLTGEDGQFFMREVGGGTRRVSVRAIGRLPFDSLVDFREGDTTRLLVSLSPVGVLETVRIKATVVSARVRAYEDRKRMGFGAYRDSSEIQRYPTLASVMTTVPNARANNGLKSLMFNMGTPAQCSGEQIDWRLDGLPIIPEALGTLDMQSLAGVEVYSRRGKLPAELASSIRFRCAVLIWTKRGFGK